VEGGPERIAVGDRGDEGFVVVDDKAPVRAWEDLLREAGAACPLVRLGRPRLACLEDVDVQEVFVAGGDEVVVVGASDLI
jgi:hypothetical protein